MTERQTSPSAQEPPHLHEQGGLTPEHWRFISSLRFSDPKINQYALAKAVGLIDEEQGPYIGRRHWNAIWLEMYERTIGLERLVRKALSPTNLHLAEEIKEFAFKESCRVATFDDCYSKKGEAFYLDDASSWGGGTPASKVYWAPEKNTWQHDFVETVYRISAPWEEIKTLTASSQIILDHWLLTDAELENPIHTSPNELMRVVREKVSVEELIERLRHKSPDYLQVAGWEKPIPQAV